MAFWAPVGGDPDARGHAPRTTSVKRGDTQVERTWWCVMTEAWRVAGESREKQSRFVFEIFKQGKRPCASKDAKLYENTLHYEWVFIVSFEFAFHVGERQGCSSARKSRNFSVKRRLWEISTSVRTSVHAFDVILVMKVPYIGQKMFACSFRVGQPALPVRPVPLQVSMPTRMCMVGRWTWSSSLVLGPQWASRLALAATRAAVLPP